MKNEELFLLEEYKSAVQLTYHIDTLRNKLTSFFISISGIAITGLLLILKKEEVRNDSININELISILLLLVALIGHIFICVLAKIRKVQIEHFYIINNIRKYFYNNDFKLWNASQLSLKTLPKPRLFSGTYFWLLIIQVLNFVILYIGIIIVMEMLGDLYTCKSLIIFTITAIISFLMQNISYFYLAKPPKEKIYSNDYLPY